MSPSARREHPLEYGFRRVPWAGSGGEIVYDPGDDATVVERYRRCPACEEWSPCAVRVASDAARAFIEAHGSSPTG
jgi:hypothetical protein